MHSIKFFSSVIIQMALHSTPNRLLQLGLPLAWLFHAVEKCVSWYLCLEENIASLFYTKYLKLPFNVILSFYVMIWRTDKRHFPRSSLLSVRPNFKDILLEKIRFVSIWHWKLSIESLTQKNFSTKRYNFHFWLNLWSIFEKK